MQSEVELFNAVPAPDDEAGFWELTAADIQGIEKALTALRKQYGSAGAAQEGRAGTRNSVANLVVYAASEAEADAANATLTALAGRHPARTLLILGGPGDGEEGINASVSAACNIEGGKRICYEEIRLQARGAGGAQLRSIVDPLLISDLPTYLWWTGDPPFRDDAFLALAGLASRVLLDSAQFGFPDLTLPRLSRFLDTDSVAAAVADLNWVRMAPLRELVAALFDQPRTAAMLPHVTRLRIERAADSGEPATAQSLLLAGWLAARLDWEPGQPGDRTYSGAVRTRLRSRGHDVVIELRVSDQRLARPGEVQSLRIEADDGTHNAVFTAARSADQEHARATVSFDDAPVQERATRYFSADDAALLGAELDELQPDAGYMEAAEMAGRLALVLPRSEAASGKSQTKKGKV